MNYVEYHQRDKYLKGCGLNPELIRDAVREMKSMALHREPNYELPADSFIEFHVREILLKAKAHYESLCKHCQEEGTDHNCQCWNDE